MLTAKLSVWKRAAHCAEAKSGTLEDEQAQLGKRTSCLPSSGPSDGGLDNLRKCTVLVPDCVHGLQMLVELASRLFAG